MASLAILIDAARKILNKHFSKIFFSSAENFLNNFLALVLDEDCCSFDDKNSSVESIKFNRDSHSQDSSTSQITFYLVLHSIRKLVDEERALISSVDDATSKGDKVNFICSKVLNLEYYAA